FFHFHFKRFSLFPSNISSVGQCDSPVAYLIDRAFPYPVAAEKAEAKFDVKLYRLTLDVPLKPAAHSSHSDTVPENTAPLSEMPSSSLSNSQDFLPDGEKYQSSVSLFFCLDPFFSTALLTFL
ncbi:unnamed protein product, partial [Protopolystoma xenopodis]